MYIADLMLHSKAWICSECAYSYRPGSTTTGSMTGDNGAPGISSHFMNKETVTLRNPYGKQYKLS